MPFNRVFRGFSITYSKLIFISFLFIDFFSPSRHLIISSFEMLNPFSFNFSTPLFKFFTVIFLKPSMSIIKSSSIVLNSELKILRYISSSAEPLYITNEFSVFLGTIQLLPFFLISYLENPR